jgi:hypothetical protein
MSKSQLVGLSLSLCLFRSLMIRKPLLGLCLLLQSLAPVIAYLTHIEITSCAKDAVCPTVPGYKTLPVNLNLGTDLDSIYLHLRNDHTSEPITDVKLVQTPNPTDMDGWTVIDVNLNQDSRRSEDVDANAIWLYYTRNTTISNRPVTSIIVKQGSHPESGVGFRRLPIDLNAGVGGEHLYLFYHQEGPVDAITAITAKSCFSDDCYMEVNGLKYRYGAVFRADIFVHVEYLCPILFYLISGLGAGAKGFE